MFRPVSKEELALKGNMLTADVPVGHELRDALWVYYPLQGENISFFSEITARNWLFIIFYFSGHKAVLWGNYNLEYPLFCEDEKELEFYKNIAAECGLEIS